MPSTRRFRTFSLSCLLAFLFGWVQLGVGLTSASAAARQADPSNKSDSNNSPSVPSALIADDPTSEVDIEVERFGVGRVARIGDWAGIRIRVRDKSSRPREVLVRIRSTDSDGDYPVAQRDMTTNPNVWQGLWLYQRLPYSFQTGDTLLVTCSEAVETGTAGSGEYRPGRRLGQMRIAAQGLAESSRGLAAIVGTRHMGLAGYTVSVGNGATAAYGHEPLEPVTGLTPDELPDRWVGLMAFDVLIWGSGEPAELRGDRAAAIREWVYRGGHLVIIMPPVGQSWTSAANNELYNLLPAVSIQRQENVDLAPYRRLLTSDDTRKLPTGAVLHTFTPAKDAAQDEAVRVLNGPDGQCVVARRLVGSGMVTLIGLDLNNRLLTDMSIIEADIFWNRVLGKRGMTKTAKEASEEASKNLAMSQRADRSVDIDLPALINKGAAAATGILMGIVVFGTYWLVAGPIGYYTLKRYNRAHWSWIVFLATGGVFTAIAWSGATAMRPGEANATHFTILDHVYGQNSERARTWMQVLIPRYGDARLSVGDPKDPPLPGGAKTVQVLTAWEARGADGSAGSFPDTREYTIDARNPSSLLLPVRSTVKQVQADWVGPPRYKFPIPVHPKIEGQATPEGPATVRLIDGQLEGVLAHQLPTALRDSTIFVIRRQTPVVGQRTNSLTAEMLVYRIRDDWLPDQTLDLAQLRGDRRAFELPASYIQGLMPTGEGGITIGDDRPNSSNLFQRLMASALFWQLEPPDFGNNRSGATVYRRHATHGYDLGKWFTQPCIIIVGYLGDPTKPFESPVPITLDGEAVPTSGFTQVRWVYPLPDNPPPMQPDSRRDPGDAPAPTPQPPGTPPK
jgi:hypothetical protein